MTIKWKKPISKPPVDKPFKPKIEQPRNLGEGRISIPECLSMGIGIFGLLIMIGYFVWRHL